MKDQQRILKLDEISKRNGLHLDKLEKLISEIHFYGNGPQLRDKMNDTFINPPSILQREKALSVLTSEIDDFMETFYEKDVA
jgi:uncharacterized protein (DUF2132 family)